MDPVSIDKNLRTIKAIERSWNQPKLPDMVSLDLAAMSGLNQKQISNFMWGIDSDVGKVINKPSPTLDLRNNIELMSFQTEPDVEPVTNQEHGSNGPSKWNRIISDVVGLQPAQAYDEDAVMNWKMQMVELGRLPRNTPIDNRWGPEYDALWRDQMDDHWEAQWRGNKYGAMSVESIAELMGEWLSPTGLFKAAVHLDLIPDFAEIGRETTWNPLTWWKAIDDVALPVLNWGLMLTGVGEVMLVSRAAYAGTKAAVAIDKALDAYKTFNGVTQATRLGRVGASVAGFGTKVGKLRHGDDIAKAGQAALQGIRAPGFIGSKMANSSRTTLQTMGKWSNQWRGYNSVAVGKTLTQQGMRIGLAGRLQGSLGIDDPGATGLDFIPGVDSASQWTYNTLPAAIIYESMFTPTHMLAVGTMKNLAPGGVLRSFANVGKEANVSEDLFSGVETALDFEIAQAITRGEDVTGLEQAKAAFVKNSKEHGRTKALMYHMFDDWTDITTEAPLEIQERFGAHVTYMAVMAAIDHAALNLSPALVRTSTARKNVQYHAARNQIINQLRYIDPDDYEQLLVARAWERAESYKDFERILAASREALASDNTMLTGLRAAYIDGLKELIKVHNAKRQDTFKMLMEGHLNAGVLKEYMGRFHSTLGKTWREFSDGMEIIDLNVAEGALEGARFSPALTDEGLSMLDTGLEFAEGSQMGDILKIVEDPEFLDFAVQSKTFNPLNKAPNTQGRFTVAKVGTVTKQDKLKHAAFVEQLLHLRTTALKFFKATDDPDFLIDPAAGGALNGLIAQVSGDLAQMDIKALDAALRRSGMKGTAKTPFDAMETMAKRRARLLRIVRYAQQQGMKVDGYEDLFIQVRKKLDDQISYLNNDPRWMIDWDVTDVAEGLDPVVSLKAKSNSLRRGATFTAAEIDPSTVPAGMVEELNKKGYKLVYGVEYATPADLNDFMVEMTDLKDAMKYRESLGMDTPLSRHMNSSLNTANYWRARAARAAAKPFTRHTRTAERHLYTAAAKSAIMNNFRHINNGKGMTDAQYNTLNQVLLGITHQVKNDYDQLLKQVKLDAVGRTYQGGLMKKVSNLRVSWTPQVPNDLVRTKALQAVLTDFLSTGTYKLKDIQGELSKGALMGKAPAREAKTVNLDFLIPEEAAQYRQALKEAGEIKDAEKAKDAVVIADSHYENARKLAAAKIIDSLKNSRVIGREIKGSATNWLDKIQSTPQLTNTMRLLAGNRKGIEYGGSWQRIMGLFARSAGGGIGAGIASASSFSLEDGWDWKDDFAIPLVGMAAGRALTTRVMVGSQNVFKKTRFRDTKLGTPIRNAFGDATLLKASLKKVEDLGTYPDVKKSLSYLSRQAASIDQGAGLSGKTGDVFGKALRSQDLKAWSYIGDSLAFWRDFFRFNLSPVFDASRYSEAIVLGQIASPLEAGKSLRFNLSPSKWRKTRMQDLAKAAGHDLKGNKSLRNYYKQQALEEWNEVQTRYRNAAVRYQDFDYDALEAATARFSQVGILGFNTYDWETSMFADLVLLHGMDDIEAYKAAKHMFTYGINPRSPAEVTMNAIFFPFSFTKKTMGHAVKFAGQDWSRTAMIHNSLRTYYELDDKYNLDDMYEAYLPAFDKVSRLNLLAAGVSLGQFGGANRPLIDTMLDLPLLPEGTIQPVMKSPLLNGFIPQVFDITDSNSMNEAFDSFQRTLPIINDINDMVDHLGQQWYMGKSLASGGHGVARATEETMGWEAAEGIKIALTAMIEEIPNKDWGNRYSVGMPKDHPFSHLSVGEYYDMEIENLYEKYPAYKDLVDSGVGVQRGVALAAEQEDLRNTFKEQRIPINEPAKTFQDPESDAFKALDYEGRVGLMLEWSQFKIEKESFSRNPSDREKVPDINRENPATNIDAATVDAIRRQYISWVNADGALLAAYNRHLLPIWGPITTRHISGID
tara:strand:- start:434 stop:6226 length:5793 start_codon:yes stop_codon:yes gene_type:complete